MRTILQVGGDLHQMLAGQVVATTVQYISEQYGAGITSEHELVRDV
jgi:hypothetical protein